MSQSEKPSSGETALAICDMMRDHLARILRICDRKITIASLDLHTPGFNRFDYLSIEDARAYLVEYERFRECLMDSLKKT